MFDDLDETIRQLLIREVPLDLTEVDISFDAPDREWSGRLSRPTVNCFLYDVRESEELREAGWEISRDHSERSVTRHQLTMRINTTYNVTIWARAPEDEHRILWRVLHALSRFRALPEELAQGALKDQPFPMLSRVARPEQTRTSAADLWQAVDNRIRPSLTYVVTLTMDPEIAITSKMTLSTVNRVEELLLIGGRVRNSTDGSLIAGAHVRLAERGTEAITGPDGGFAFRARRGTATLEIKLPGRDPFRRSAEVPSATYDIEV